ncbi:hypothetical protein HB943_09700 [Listeria weihenstephanensis]|uniref:Uncharacterized protein n=1 Tax=Listeria weihenstephanensis TaxID=1006155 RepID=A0A841Z6K0_9LIST|nr:hypothetical protein [Listeria weihenstephanensis]MBC1500880.1 hypothetical protein [Listeria weihenstephanensis]
MTDDRRFWILFVLSGSGFLVTRLVPEKISDIYSFFCLITIIVLIIVDRKRKKRSAEK